MQWCALASTVAHTYTSKRAPKAETSSAVGVRQQTPKSKRLADRSTGQVSKP